MSSLQKDLERRRRTSRIPLGRNKFYVLSEVREVLSLDRIRECISRHTTRCENPRDAHRFSTLIQETSLSIFAILILDGHDEHIFDFLYRRETDARLKYTLDGLYFLPDFVRQRFFDRQWELCPVIFKADEIPRELAPCEILPFLEDEKVGEGAFGTVFKVHLPITCQDLFPAQERTPQDRDGQVTEATDVHEILIARKELRAKRKGDDERVVLDLLGTLRHPNIIQFLGSYIQNNVENLLFPYVPTDLSKLFASRRHMEPHEMYFGMYGIADALSQIHDFSFKDGSTEVSRIGCHHDFRPSNILVQGNTFLISDFGLSGLRADDRDSKSRLKGGHDDYLGPEAFDSNAWTNGVVGRALDIWSFGCMLAEVATFIERRDVQEFTIKREASYGTDIIVTDCAFHLGGTIRPAVLEWVRELVSSSTNPQVSQLVDLVVEMLNPNPYRRIKIAAVSERLAFIWASSQAQAISGQFVSALPSTMSNLNNVTVQIFLERKRFDSWLRIFNGLHASDRLHNFVSVSNNLSSLWETLVLVNAKLKNSSETEQEAHTTFNKAQTILDSLIANLPSGKRREIQDEWTRTVCEEQDTAVLLAVRSIGGLNRYRQVGASAAMRYMSRVITASISRGTRSRLMDSGCVEIDERSSNEPEDPANVLLIKDRTRTMGHIYDDSGRKRIMIEWKEYDHRWQGDQGNKLFTAMDALVDLLDPDVTHMEGIARDRVLTCRGYFHESRNWRFGFVYTLPPFTVEDVQLFSLNNVIRMTLGGDGFEDVGRPNLGDIFKLAKDLAQSLCVFHNAGWVHKNITSHHLLVFSPSPQLVHEYVVSAVLAGFNDSRPEASDYTFGPGSEFIHYQHPLYEMGTGFRRSFDYFGLGIVLLELGLWLPASVLRSEHPDMSSEAFRKKLLQSYVPQLGETMGAIYRDAVAFCLDLESVLQSEQEPGAFAPDVRALFARRVVEPLSRCVA